MYCTIVENSTVACLGLQQIGDGVSNWHLCCLCQAETELSEAEPALLAAQSSVRSIKKPQLDEIRTLTR